jgi:hypothetical protein
MTLDHFLPAAVGPGIKQMGDDNPSLDHGCHLCGFDHYSQPACPGLYEVQE